MDKVVIRAARASDAEAMPGLEQSAGDRFRSLPGWDWVAEGDNRSLAAYRDFVAGGWCWVAGHDDRHLLCGFIAAERFAGELHIHELAVALDRQRQGIGRSLLCVAISTALAQGLEAVTLTTFTRVPWNQPFYARMGFVRPSIDRMGERLTCILEREAAAGLPIDLRCAMRLSLDPDRQIATARDLS
jgi:GNAT superfamily N-acetyltransferase